MHIQIRQPQKCPPEVLLTRFFLSFQVALLFRYLEESRPELMATLPSAASPAPKSPEVKVRCEDITEEHLDMCNAQVQLDYTGLEIADPMLDGTGMDLMAAFSAGQTLDRKFAAMICDQVTS